VTRDSIGGGQRSRIKIGMRVITANGDDLTETAAFAIIIPEGGLSGE
jgi:hypothetical protein